MGEGLRLRSVSAASAGQWLGGVEAGVLRAGRLARVEQLLAGHSHRQGRQRDRLTLGCPVEQTAEPPLARDVALLGGADQFVERTDADADSRVDRVVAPGRDHVFADLDQSLGIDVEVGRTGASRQVPFSSTQDPVARTLHGGHQSSLQSFLFPLLALFT